MNQQENGVKPDIPSSKVEEEQQTDARAEIHGEQESSPLAPPTLSEFISEKQSPAVLFKAIKQNRTKRFTQADEDHAITLMKDHDRDGERLWSLMSQVKLPDAVDRWVWRAAQERLSAELGGVFDPLETDAGRVLKALKEAVSAHINSEQKEERKQAENWLRIGVCWLVAKRSLAPWLVAEALLPTFYPEKQSARKASARVLQRGQSKEFKAAIAMAGLGQAMVEHAQTERDQQAKTANSLRHQLSDERIKIEDLNHQISALSSQLEQALQAQNAAKAQLDAERQHWGHDLSETKAEQRVLLAERVAPLLSDARDALEIEPPAPQVAIKRLKAVISIIGGKTDE